MTNPTVLPLPESTYQLLRDAARTWPGAVATQWIPDPSDHTHGLTWTYAELSGMVTRIANALTSLGVRRQDEVTLSGVNTSMLYAATLAALAVGIAAPVNPALGGERLAELLHRTQSRVLVAAGPQLDEQLWQRLLAVAHQVGMTAVLVLPPDGVDSEAPALPTDPDLAVTYLDEVIAGQPVDRLVGAQPPAPQDLAAFVHTGGTTGSPKVAPHTHANQLACGQAISQSSGLTAGESILAGLPLFHVNALLVTGIAPMFGGQRVVWPSPVGYRDPAIYARVPVAYVVPADPDRFDEAELTAWAATTIDEPAARPKHIYPITAIPTTEVGKYHKPTLVADAAVRAVADALASRGVAARDIQVVHEQYRLVVTVAGVDPDKLTDAVAGSALTVRAAL